jgi:hypothetical protein
MADDTKSKPSKPGRTPDKHEFSSQPPERQQPKRPEGFGQTAPTTSNGKNAPPQRERPDVFVDAHAHVGRIEFHLDNLKAAVRLHAQVLDLLELSVGADASLEHIGLLIEDVQVDALVEVRLDAVENIVVRLIEAIDHNPEIIRDLTRGVGKAVEHVGEGVEEIGSGVGSGVDKTLEGVGSGADKALGGVGEGVSSLGEGVGSGADKALGGVGEGVSSLGEGAGEGVKEVGKGAGKGVEGLGQGAGAGIKGAGEGVGKGVEKTGEGVKGAGEGVGKAVSNDDNNKENDKSVKSTEGRDGQGQGHGRGRSGKRAGGIAERTRRRHGRS